MMIRIPAEKGYGRKITRDKILPVRRIFCGSRTVTLNEKPINGIHNTK